VVYIGIGMSFVCVVDPNYVMLVRNAILWGGGMMFWGLW